MHTNPNTPKTRRSPLPDLARHPAVLLAAILIPQAILLIANLRAFHLISGEVSDDQRRMALCLFAGELTLMLGGSALAVLLWKRARTVAWGWNWAIFLPHAAYLAWAAMEIHDLVPASLRLWIVQPESLLFYQFVGLMPAAFVSALALACFPTRLSRGGDIGLSILVAAAVPGFWYLVNSTRLGEELFNWPQFAIVVMVVTSSLICLTGFLRVLTLVFGWVAGKGAIGQSILVALVAIVGPLGGLALNAKYPFPADFQAWQIYALALANGLLLLAPGLGRPGLDRAIWLAQCAFLPFTLYFFFVFLPFLPLSAIAMIVAGAGFLILTPTALFIVHLRKLGQGLKAGHPLWMGAVAACIIPLYACGEARLDRLVLNHAVDYVFSPNFQHKRFAGCRLAVKRSLTRLQNIKDGRYLPFLTDFYNAVAFDNLVLSDAKMQTVHRALFGKELPGYDRDSDFGDIFGRRSGRASNRRRLASAPPQTARLERVTSTTQAEGLGTRTLVRLDLTNPSNSQSEYFAPIRIPSGVFVAGYWLHVAGERVPGRIVERKTAMWVYRMIRDITRRDPGLLVYTGADTLELRVFPFAPGEERVTEIEFIAPPGIAADVEIGGRLVEAGVEPSTQVSLAPAGDGSQLVALGAGALDALPKVTRQPYFHFIIDRSEAGLSQDEALEAIQSVAARFPQVRDCAVTAANYEFGDVTPGIVPVSALGRYRGGRAWLRKRGTLLQDRAIQRVLAEHRDFLDQAAGSSDLLRVPAIAVIRPSGAEPIFGKNLEKFGALTPDMGRYFTQTGALLEAWDFAGKSAPAEILAQPVGLLKSGSAVAVCAIEPKTRPSSVFIGGTGDLGVYSPETRRFVPVANVETHPETSRYAGAARVAALDERLTWNPWQSHKLLGEIVETGRETRVLSASTSYIVVENSAQWKMLERKQRQKLKANANLDFMETPAPEMWLVALIFGVGVALRRRFGGKFRLVKR